MRALAAALHTYLLWNAITPHLGKHPTHAGRVYSSFASELQQRLAVPAALLDVFAQMRDASCSADESFVRAVCSCASLRRADHQRADAPNADASEPPDGDAPADPAPSPPLELEPEGGLLARSGVEDASGAGGACDDPRATATASALRESLGML